MTEHHQRASDADRDTVVRQLTTHTAAGRLTQREFTDRMEAALRATTRADLAALVADLPTDQMPAPAGSPAPRERRSLRTRLWPAACLLPLLAVALAVTIGSGTPVALVVLGTATTLCVLGKHLPCGTSGARSDR